MNMATHATELPPAVAALRQLKASLHADEEYAWAWQSVFAQTIIAELGCTHEQGNKAAARIMYNSFDIDVKKQKAYQDFLPGWADDALKQAPTIVGTPSGSDQPTSPLAPQ